MPKSVKLQPLPPAELRSLPQWVVVRDGVPFDPNRPYRNAKANDASTWGTFETAVRLVRSGRFDGVAFVFTADDPYIGIDLDACRDPKSGKLALWAAAIVDQLDTYTEISRSGTGLHLVLKVEVDSE